MIEDSTQILQIEEKRLVVLDSKIPTTLTASSISKKSDLIFDLEIPIIRGVDDLQLKCSIKNAVFPNSFYTINATNSYISITLFYGTTLDTNTNISLSVPFGNYSSYLFIQQLQTLINTEYTSKGYPQITFTLSLLANTNQIKFSFVDTNHTYTDFRISFQPSNIGTINSISQMGDIIGFLNDFDYLSGNVVSIFNTNAIFSNISGIIISPYPCNLSGLKCFNVILRNYNTSSIPIQSYTSQIGFKNSIKNSNYNNSSVTTYIRNNIMCNISVNANPGEYIFYDKQSDFFIDIKEYVLQRIHIQIVDNLGNLLEFNNQDWTMTLEFSLLKNKEIKTKSFYEILQTGRF